MNEYNPHCGIHDSTDRDEKQKNAMLNRLKKIEGQIRGLQRMVEEDAYCPDILVQVSAATSALNSFNKVLLENHLKGCVTRDIQNGNLDTIDELAKVMQKLMK
ncbi:MAG: metal-sensing transcriptional repressor [Lachnospiraceae bacterium]|nr:metal-sensing transcriptional repressor [Lachnospiraceae bacterium]